MTTQPKPTYEQLEVALQDTQFAMSAALEQRNVAMNQVIDAGTALNRMRMIAQDLRQQLAESVKVVDLTDQLASAPPRAGKK